MAEKRMFSKTIISCDDFTELPFSTQALYFHLSMEADDDGFVNNSKKIMRTIRVTKKDMDRLVAKGYIIPFDSGVYAIRHWRINNYIRKDRYTPTIYLREMEQLEVDGSGAYKERLPIGVPNGAPSCNRLGAQKRIEESSIEQCRERDARAPARVEEPIPQEEPIPEERSIIGKSPCGEFGNVYLTEAERSALDGRYGASLAEALIDNLSRRIKSKGYRYEDHYATILDWAAKDGVKTSSEKSYDTDEFFQAAVQRSLEE
ncbi:MAG: replisome organizer [Clostridia bacterium]|nr:replisome organizer [Clostridia bacterium]MBQ8836479.1 replisome organizer [Clostridia bacterium]